MPTYEYQCSQCDSVFDVYQSIKAAPLKKMECAHCGAVRPVRRLIGTGGAVIFKGSGFYQTDYRSENYKKSASSESQSKSDAPKGDSKPETSSGKTPSGKTPSAPEKSETKSSSKSEPDSSKPARKAKQ
ncbi:MAG TPA: FmdB family zinc ribbon protein [Phycisphaerae bacterium]|nr:FmdB family zinc ribbon protein [Phycisphaerae bacterium]